MERVNYILLKYRSCAMLQRHSSLTRETTDRPLPRIDIPYFASLGAKISPHLVPVDPMLIDAIACTVDFTNGQKLHIIHHPRRGRERDPQRLPSFELLHIAVFVQVRLRVRIDVFGPELPLDEKNGGILHTALVQDSEARAVFLGPAFVKVSQVVETGCFEIGVEFCHRWLRRLLEDFLVPRLHERP